MKKIIYRESDGVIIDVLEADATVSGLAEGLATATGEYSGTERNISEIADAIKDVTYITARTVFERLVAINKAEIVIGALTQIQLVNFLTLKEGIAVNDSEVIAILTAIGVDPGTILY